MALPSLYNAKDTQAMVDRIARLTPQSTPLWGTMNVSTMLAHCNVTYEYVFDERKDKPNFLLKFFLKAFVKDTVTNEVPYKHNERTGPAFIIADEREFEKEKTRLLNYIQSVLDKGESYFVNKESVSFGVLTPTQWNNMMYKHLDHHMNQFGV